MTRLVLLHGAGGGPEVWHAVGRQLARAGIEVDAPALPGHRDGGAGFESIAAYADWLAARLDEPTAVGGSSMGGAIALWLALERPELVERLIVVGTSARMRVGQLVFDLVDRYDADAQAELARLQLAPGADERAVRKSAELIALVPQAVTRGDFVACDGFDVRERLGEVVAPTLAIVGEHDLMTPPKRVAQLAEGIPGAALVTVDGTGHLPMVEQPRAVTRALTEFLS